MANRPRSWSGPAGKPSDRPTDLGKWRKTCREASGEVFDAVQNRARSGDISAARLIVEQAWGRVPTEEQVMTRAEYDAEFKRMAGAFVDGLAKVLERFPGANEAVGAELERQEQRATGAQK
jgi:hypothetical protein